MRSPVVAMLWENWRLTRVEAAQRLGLGLVVGAGLLALFDNGATAAFVMLVALHSLIWFSIAKLSGGRFADGYKPGFPLYLLYTRPVPTPVIVGVALVYDAFSCVLLYLVSAAVLGVAFGQPLPSFSVTLWMVINHFAYACTQWSTRSRVAQWVGSIAFCLTMFFVLKSHVSWPLRVEFSLTENAAMVLTGVVLFGLTVAGVARQRRGEAVAAVPRAKGEWGGYPDWLVTLVRFRCPTSSATRAQVWFELKSSGLPVLIIGMGLAVLILLFCAISTAFGHFRFAAIPIALLAVPLALFSLGGNAFGIRRKQGRTYASAFELTQPYGTTQLASLKVFVRAACLLLALMAIVASLWASISLVGAWSEWVLNNNQDVRPEISKVQQAFAGSFSELTAPVYAALAVVVSISTIALVAWLAAREAIRGRHPRLLLVVQWLPVVYSLAIILLTLAMRKGFGPVPLVGEIIGVSFWVSAAAMVLATIYLSWNGFAQSVLTIPHACGALGISVAFAAAWLLGIPAAGVAAILWLSLLVLTLSVLAPWSLNRIRHA